MDNEYALTLKGIDNILMDDLNQSATCDYLIHLSPKAKVNVKSIRSYFTKINDERKQY
ncbi:hypothetical protein MNBD_NITROSPINAE02-1378 [hydrothermal vent metagenome]|uniref:Uncharacterized protein n=1 Tax=hydrothermal vent metagenome TaxID=652676 RepID=A0A3B1CM93_9ZZZZ